MTDPDVTVKYYILPLRMMLFYDGEKIRAAAEIRLANEHGHVFTQKRFKMPMTTGQANALKSKIESRLTQLENATGWERKVVEG